MTFYWNKGKKVELSKSTTHRSVRFSGNVTPQSRQQTAAAMNVREAAPNTPNPDALELGKGLFLYKTSTRSQALPAEACELTVFATPSGDPMILTERFNVRFKEEVTRQQIDALNTQNKVRIVRESKRRKNAFVLAVQADAGADALAMANRYHDSGLTLYSEPNFVRTLKPASAQKDLLFAQQWALKNTGQRGGIAGQDIRAVDAWNASRGSDKITVAIIDVGVDYTHPDLITQMVPGYDATDPGGGTGTVGPTPTESHHGTACAGIIAAAADNEIGISGVAPLCRMMGIKIGFMPGGGLPIFVDDDDVADGIETAVDMGADVLCIGWTYPSGVLMSGDVDNAISDAITNGRPKGVGGAPLGCVVCCAAGNEGLPAIPDPASHPDVITVTACNQWGKFKTTTSQDGEGYWGSNFGAGVDICAPGVKIHTTFESILGNPNRYMDFSGTSASAAHVAGVVALILSVRPSLTSAGVKTILDQSGDDIGALPNEMGRGRINAHKALYHARVLNNRVSNKRVVEEFLNPGQQLDSSPDGQFSLFMRLDGNLEITGPEGRIWASSTDTPGSVARLRNGGNFAVYGLDGNTVLWESGTDKTNASEARLTNDGHLILYRMPANVPVWSTQSMLSVGVRLKEGGKSLTSLDGTMSLKMDKGNLELWQGGTKLWESRTASATNPGVYAELKDGNFVVFDKDDKPVWASGIAKTDAVFVQLDNGAFTLRTRKGEIVWSTRSVLIFGKSLNTGDSLLSPNNKVRLFMDFSRNLRLFDDKLSPLWFSPNPSNFGPASAKLLDDGDFAIVDGGNVFWNSKTDDKKVGYLKVQDDGYFALYTQLGVQVWAMPPKVPHTLGVGEKLEPGASLVSPNGRYVLTLTTNGNLELREAAASPSSTPPWESKSKGNNNPYAELRDKGDFVVVNAANEILWRSETSGSDAVSVQVKNDGFVVLCTKDGQEVWGRPIPATSRLTVGERLMAGDRRISQNGQYILKMEANGNLEFRDAAGRLWWASSTDSNPGAYAELLEGNFVVRVKDGANEKTLWQSGASGNAVVVQLDNKGYFELLTDMGNAVWSSRTMLSLNTRLNPKEELVSLDGAMKLCMQENGNLELLSVGSTKPLWSSDTAGNLGAYAQFCPKGNLTVFSNTNTVLWTSMPKDQGAVFARLETGHFAFFKRDNIKVWSTQSILGPEGRLTAGAPLFSPNGQVRLEMLTGGNMVLLSGNSTRWLSATAGNSGAHAKLEKNGDFIIYTPAGAVRWKSDTPGAEYLAVQDDNTFVLRKKDGTVVKFYPPPGWP